MTRIAPACLDCGDVAEFGLFTGTTIRQCCKRCSRARAQAEPPACTLSAGWVIGHAAQTNLVFTNLATHHRDAFVGGCFRQAAATELIALGVEHEVCRCKDAGRSVSEPREALLDWNLALASTRNGTLRIDEDPYGLFFAAYFPLGACVSTGDGPQIDLHHAIGAGVVSGLSLHHHGAVRIQLADHPDVLALADLRLPEISLCLAEPPSSPGTWVMPVGAAAMRTLYQRLSAASESQA